MIRFCLILIASLLAILPAPALAERLQVSRVKDGDTFEIVGKTQFGLATSIRVFGIDTPESAMPSAKCEAEREHGDKAKAAARNLIAASGNMVWTTGAVKRDKYNGRYLATVWLRINGRRVNYASALIKAGLALPYAPDAQGHLIKPDWCAILAAKAPANLIPPGF